MNESFDWKSSKESLEGSCTSEKNDSYKSDSLILNKMADLIQNFVKNKKQSEEIEPINEDQERISSESMENQLNQNFLKSKILQTIKNSHQQWYTQMDELQNQSQGEDEQASEKEQEDEDNEVIGIEEKQYDDQEEEEVDADDNVVQVTSPMEDSKNQPSLRKPAARALKTRTKSAEKRLQFKARTSPRSKLQLMNLKAKNRKEKNTKMTKVPQRHQVASTRPIDPPIPKKKMRQQHEMGQIIIKIKEDESIKKMILKAKQVQENQLKAVQASRKEQAKKAKPQLVEIKFKIKIPIQSEPPAPKARMSILKKVLNLAQQKNNTKKMASSPANKVSLMPPKPACRINLGSFSLLQIVKELSDNNILPVELYEEFQMRHSDADIKDFIHKFNTGKLRNFNFKSIKFTLMDHRRLADLLITLFPERYYQQNVFTNNDEVNAFLCKIYEQTEEEYYDLYTKVDLTSKIIWWSQLIVKNHLRISKGVKRNFQEQNNKKTNIDEAQPQYLCVNVKSTLKPNRQTRFIENPKKRVKFA